MGNNIINNNAHNNTKTVVNRLSRAIGHLQAVKKMVEDGRDCSEVLIQIAAVKSSVNNIGKLILKDHMENCIFDAIKMNDMKSVEDLNDAIDKFIK